MPHRRSPEKLRERYLKKADFVKAEKNPKKPTQVLSVRSAGTALKRLGRQYRRPHKQILIDKFGKCMVCGWDELPDALELHHKDRNHQNNDPTNLVLLCPNCHALLHRGKIEWEVINELQKQQKGDILEGKLEA
jgi:5-methylcytosine-specific restriction endonuclease McrA